MQTSNDNNLTFSSILNSYLTKLNCTANQLAKASNLSASLISRYRSGEIIPKQNSKQINALIDGIIIIAKEKNIKSIIKYDINMQINSSLNSFIDFEILKINLNLLISSLNINVASISRYLGYDSSYLSKIRSGIRKPAHINDFVNAIAKYIIANYSDDTSKKNIIKLLNEPTNTNFNELQLEEKIINWLSSNTSSIKNDDNVQHFLTQLDDFNLENYIKVIHFDELKIPTIPIMLPKSKNYYGLEEMKQGELDFLKGTVLSKNKNDVFMCSDMQMSDLAEDKDFSKKWMYGIAMMLKKGLHINIIHNIDRPFNEMMIGLESWIPIYMSGQVSPFYLKNYSNKIYSHLNYVSSDYALCGECINNYHKKGKYYLTNNKKEIIYYQEKSKFLLKKATPLMVIYNSKNIKEFHKLFENDSKAIGDRKRILSSLPLHTLSNKLLMKILAHNNIKSIDRFEKYLSDEKKWFEEITKTNTLTDEVHLINKEEFNKSNYYLNVDKYTNDYNIIYTYDEYLEHYNETIKYKCNNYVLIENKIHSFDNIDIYINFNNYVIISKKNNPNIHFVITHEKLRNAIENFTPPIIDIKK